MSEAMTWSSAATKPVEGRVVSALAGSMSEAMTWLSATTKPVEGTSVSELSESSLELVKSSGPPE